MQTSAKREIHKIKKLPKQCGVRIKSCEEDKAIRIVGANKRRKKRSNRKSTTPGQLSYIVGSLIRAPHNQPQQIAARILLKSKSLVRQTNQHQHHHTHTEKELEKKENGLLCQS